MSAPYIGNTARLKTRLCTGLTVLAMVMSVLSGCATDGKVPPRTVADNRTEVKETSVMRLEDGREGFIISEVPQMDETSRRDFESAVAMLNDQDYDRAIDLLEKIIERSPGVTAPYINIAIAYQHIDKPEQFDFEPFVAHGEGHQAVVPPAAEMVAARSPGASLKRATLSRIHSVSAARGRKDFGSLRDSRVSKTPEVFSTETGVRIGRSLALS